MKLRIKIKLLLIFVLSIAMIVPTLITVLGIRREAREESAMIRSEEEEQLRATLENLVESVFTNVSGQYLELTTRKYQEINYGVVSRAFIEHLDSQLRLRMQHVKAGRMSLEEARSLTLEEFRAIRFGGDEGYVWIQDLGTPTPNVIMHPTLPEFEGVASDTPRLQTAENSGENVFAAAARIASASKDGGYLDYLITRAYPDGRRLERVPKLSFVKYLPEWKWVIGTGIPLDKIVEDGRGYILEDLRKIRFQHGAGAFWVCDTQGKILIPPPGAGGIESTATESTFIAKAVELMRDKDTVFFDQPLVNPLTGRTDRHLFHAQLFEPFQWIIGTGMNAASVDREAEWELEKAEAQVWRFCLLLVGFMIVLMAISMRLVTGILQEYGVFGLEEAPHASPTVIPVKPSPETGATSPAAPENGKGKKKK